MRALSDKNHVPAPELVETADVQGLARDPAHFAGREGYDAGFLDIAVALPVVPPELDIASPSDATPARPHELRYQHFSILYSLTRKSPVIAALNIDGAQTRRIKRGRTRWRKDLRVPADGQLDRGDYADPDIDRGHMVRRAATNWGPDDETARRADQDTYHYTVASPQHKGLNQNATTWLGLEDHIMENVRTFGFRASVFTGPIFSEDDPPLGESGARIPLSYFKVVCMMAQDDGGRLDLHATAYVLSQSDLVGQMLRETGAPFAFGAFGTFQLHVADLEAMTGYDFGLLRAADPLAKEGLIRVQPLQTLEQVRL